MNRKRLLTSAAGVLVVAAVVGGVAYATIPDGNGVYNACMLKGVGTIRLIDKSLPSTNLMSHCTDKEIETSWNQAGQPGPSGPQGAKGDPGAPGTNGNSIAMASEPAGANCADGGVQLTAVNGVSYVCDGKQGTKGEDGAPGAKGDKGDEGPTGPIGPPGPSGPLAGYEIVNSSVDIPAGSLGNGAVDCPAGKRVLGGGASAPDAGLPQSALLRSYPDSFGVVWSWQVTYFNGTSFPVTVRVYAVCASAA